MGDAGAKAFAAGLAGSPITELILVNNGITDVGATALARALPGATLCGRLQLGHNNLGPASAKAFAEALAHESAPRDLDLGGNPIGAKGVEALATALASSPVTALDLGQTGLGDKGAEALAAALPASKLRTLRLHDNGIGTPGAEALAAAVPAAKLEVLGLGWDIGLTPGNKRIGVIDRRDGTSSAFGAGDPNKMSPEIINTIQRLMRKRQRATYIRLAVRRPALAQHGVGSTPCGRRACASIRLQSAPRLLAVVPPLHATQTARSGGPPWPSLN